METFLICTKVFYTVIYFYPRLLYLFINQNNPSRFIWILFLLFFTSKKLEKVVTETDVRSVKEGAQVIPGKTWFQLPQAFCFLFPMIISVFCCFSATRTLQICPAGSQVMARFLRHMRSCTGTGPHRHTHNSHLIHLGKSGSPLSYGCWTLGSRYTRVASGLLQESTCVPPGRENLSLWTDTQEPPVSVALGIGEGLGVLVFSSSIPSSHTRLQMWF